MRVITVKADFRVPCDAVHARIADARRMPKSASPLSPEAKARQANLALWRKARKLSLKALAEQTGFAVSTLNGWELGTRAVDTEDLERLGRFYGVHPAALLLHPDTGRKDVSDAQAAASAALSMDPEARAEWLALAKRFKRSTPSA